MEGIVQMLTECAVPINDTCKESCFFFHSHPSWSLLGIVSFRLVGSGCRYHGHAGPSQVPHLTLTRVPFSID